MLWSVLKRNKIASVALLYWLVASPLELLYGNPTFSERIQNFCGMVLLTSLCCLVCYGQFRRSARTARSRVDTFASTKSLLRWSFVFSVAVGVTSFSFGNTEVPLLLGALMMPFVWTYFTVVFLEARSADPP